MNRKQYLHCDFIVEGDSFIFFSYDNFLLEFKLKNHKIQFSESINADICGMILKNDSIERLIRINDTMTAISISGKKIYFYNVMEKRWKEITIECDQFRYGNYIDIVYNYQFIYVIPQYRTYILKIDIQKECAVKIEIPFLMQLNNQKTAVYLKENNLYFFESQSERILIFNVDTGKCAQSEIDCRLGIVASVQYEKGNFLILSDGGALTRWTEGSNHMELIIEPVKEQGTNYFLEFAVTAKNIWLLPMRGEHIYVYELQDRMLKQYDRYPQNFSYLGSNGHEKFLKGHEYKNKIYFGMHSASHFLVIEKNTGIAEWIAPIFPSEVDVYLFRMKHGLKLSKNEGTYSLEVFLKALVKQESQSWGRKKNIENGGSHSKPSIGETIHAKVKEIHSQAG